MQPALAGGHQALVARKSLRNKPSTTFLCDDYCREGFLSVSPKLITRISQDLRKAARLLGRLKASQPLSILQPLSRNRTLFKLRPRYSVVKLTNPMCKL